ncbi:MAG: hypothetical protein Q4G16_02600 [Cruoricaptor ignavus]|nr:hypothetical protein [Cruoricaptor ignavus]
MKYFYKSKRRKFYGGRSPQELVKKMRRRDMQETVDVQDFMRVYSARNSTFNKIVLRTKNEETFVEDLIKVGIVEKKMSLSFLKKFLEIITKSKKESF